MATRTISNAGGNWNAIGAWVEGIVAIAGDAVVATATSGNLVVNVASACASIILTNYSGTLTFDASLTVTSTVTFVSGMTIAGTAGTLILTTGGQTITSGGKTLTCALTFSGTGIITWTMADDWTVNGLVTVGTSSTPAISGVGRVLHCKGGFAVTGTPTVAGTAKFSVEGGTWSSATINGIQKDVDLAGNVTVSGSVAWGVGGKTLRYVSGMITTAGSTLAISSTGALDTAGVVWDNVTFSTNVTYALTSALAWSGTLTFGSTLTISGAALSGTGAVSPTAGSTVTLNNTGGLVTTGTLTLPNAAFTFAGSAGFTVGTLTTAALNASRIHTLTYGNTYTVTTSLASLATSAFRQALKSSSPGNKVVFNLSPAATQQLVYCDPTDVDSSGGQTVVSIGGTITTSTNWVGSVPAGGGSPAPAAVTAYAFL